MRFCARCDNCRWVCEASAAPMCGRTLRQLQWGPPTEAAYSLRSISHRNLTRITGPTPSRTSTAI
jgi:hypothetical protein